MAVAGSDNNVAWGYYSAGIAKYMKAKLLVTLVLSYWGINSSLISKNNTSMSHKNSLGK